MGCHLWGRTESDTTETTEQQQQNKYIYSFIILNWLRVFIRCYGKTQTNFLAHPIYIHIKVKKVKSLSHV